MYVARMITVGGVALLSLGLASCQNGDQPEVSSRAPVTTAAAQSPIELESTYEFEPYPGSRWYDPNGEDVSEGSNVINAITGPDHCNWESAVMMHVGWPLGHDASDISEARQYLRDPEGLFQNGMLMTTFEANVELPKGATYTGYQTEFMQLWLDSKDHTAAYLVFDDHVERWPRAQEVIACA